MFDPIMYLKVFMIGGLVCLIGQVLIITTQMTSARILVSFLVFGVVLEVLGVFTPLKEWAGSGVTVPIMGFGHTLAKGAMEGYETDGVLGLIKGALEASSPGITVAVVSAFIFALIFNSKTKK